ncbi:esterase/lipase family protein [Corynebacterium qintianiae]|uniref:esterase/lipase family protein n=1 Tax=Corynebacterium qintianiae TaxID=2709392 RepID=UPI0013EC9EF4|nr:alpha/beta fold hydrolase [Corynebacterium qintianiae]
MNRLSCAVATAAMAASLTAAPAHAAGSSATLPEAPFNDPTCVPAPEHPYPVVFLHGTSANASKFEASAQQLVDDGYCAYTLNYGREKWTIQSISPSVYGTADLLTSAEEVATFIDHVLDTTGAEKVDIVAHSQGALQAKNYISRFGNADRVNRVVAMGASLHGTTLNGQGEFLLKLVTAMPTLAAFFASTSAIQQLAGSAAMAEHNALPDTAAGVTYMSFYSPHDTTVTPNSASYFNPVPGANVVNLDAEAVCSPAAPITHPDMPSNPTMMALTKWGLERPAEETLPSAAACAPAV